MADKTGRTVIFNQINAQCLLETNSDHFTCTSAVQNGNKVPFLCATPNSSEISIYGYTHKIPHHKNLSQEFSDIDWGHFVTPSGTSEMSSAQSAAAAQQQPPRLSFPAPKMTSTFL